MSIEAGKNSYKIMLMMLNKIEQTILEITNFFFNITYERVISVLSTA